MLLTGATAAAGLTGLLPQAETFITEGPVSQPHTPNSKAQEFLANNSKEHMFICENSARSLAKLSCGIELTVNNF